MRFDERFRGDFKFSDLCFFHSLALQKVCTWSDSGTGSCLCV